MKRILTGSITLLLALVFVVSLTGCGEKANNPDNGNNEPKQVENNQKDDNQEQKQQGTKNTSVSDDIGWPENELTKQVPKPDQKFTKEASGDDVAYYTYPNWTIDEARAYTEKIKSLGFVVSSTLSDDEEDYLIYLKSADGEYQVSINANGSEGMLIISIPINKR